MKVQNVDHYFKTKSMLLFDQPIFFLNLDFNVARQLLIVEMLSKVVFVFFYFIEKLIPLRWFTFQWLTS